MTAPLHQSHWKETIERYNRELMAQYAVAQVQALEEETNNKTPPATNDVTSASDDATASTDTSALTDIGYLQVRITTENQAIPIVGAVVNVTHDFGEGTVLDFTEITDQNGLTSVISLPTKDRQLSLTPGTPVPYASYTVNITADGYFTKRFEELPIYGGVTAFQNVSMIPLPEAGDKSESIDYPPPAPILS